jgi:hypothetical protein
MQLREGKEESRFNWEANIGWQFHGDIALHGPVSAIADI